MGVSPRACSSPLPQLGEVVAKAALHILWRHRLAIDILQSPALIIADVETHQIVFPGRFGDHAPQPAEEDSGIGPRSVQHRHARLDGDRPIIAGLLGKINTDETSSHRGTSKARESLVRRAMMPFKPQDSE